MRCDMMKIRTNKYNILESQMILLSEEDSELWLSIIVDNTNLGELHLCFESSEQIDNHNLKIEPEENGLKIIFKNFNNPFGSGTAKPILIGQIAEAKLYFMCWSYLLGQHKNTRKIEYTIFKERV